MAARLTKGELRALLERSDFDAVLRWAESARSPQRMLMSLAFETDVLLRWRAIDAYARVAALRAERDLEKVRESIRALLWLMNDESGGLGWNAPEMVAEILVRVPELIPEFGVLLPHFLREEPFERGSHYAVYRVASLAPELFGGSESELRESLKDPDPATRAWAALALRVITRNGCDELIRDLESDPDTFSVYDWETAELHKTSVGDAIRAAPGPS
jgi:hypothetical protein